MIDIQPATFTVESARPSDAEIIEALYREAFLINYPGGDWDRILAVVRVRIAEAVGTPMLQHGVLAARTSDGLFAGYIWWKCQRAPDGVDEAKVLGIGVVHDFRRRGVGKLLAEGMMHWVRGLQYPGGCRVTAEVSATNDAALALIAHFGGSKRTEIYSRDFGPVENGDVGNH